MKPGQMPGQSSAQIPHGCPPSKRKSDKGKPCADRAALPIRIAAAQLRMSTDCDCASVHSLKSAGKISRLSRDKRLRQQFPGMFPANSGRFSRSFVPGKQAKKSAAEAADEARLRKTGLAGIGTAQFCNSELANRPMPDLRQLSAGALRASRDKCPPLSGQAPGSAGAWVFYIESTPPIHCTGATTIRDGDNS
ncbi:hypothetical protein [Derxia lacustris]|uniref:hypothetical protein n=1 Tax=Derxia lacustris TaxID=764842 RepID=UPI00111C1E2A|nr:hypothetical protein [Derxia lacustris]